jgi:hypothetical protein
LVMIAVSWLTMKVAITVVVEEEEEESDDN